MRPQLHQLLALLFFTASALAQEAPHPPKGLQLTAKCVQHLRGLNSKYQDIEFGWITVSQSPENSRPVHVFYQTHILKNKKGEIANPVIFFNGGPSMSSHGSLQSLLSVEEYKSNISLIIFDQRGTGCSSPYPNTPEVSDLSDFGSRQIVNDAEALRQFLKISKWTAFGQSYGGLVVQRYVETHPESLNKVILHGMSLGSIRPEAAIQRFEKGVTMLADFLVNHPYMAEQIQTIKQKIPDDYCIESSRFFKLCGQALMDLHVVFTRNINQSEAQKSFQSWIQYLYDAVVVSDLRPDHPVIKNYWAQLSKYAIGQDVSRHYWEQVISKQEITVGFTDLETGLLFQADTMSLISEARLFRSFQYEDDSFLDVVTDAISLKTVRKHLKMYPNLKMYVFAGEKDIFSPAATIRGQYQEHLNLDNVIFKVFENSGHEGFQTEPDLIRSVIH